LQKGLSFSPDVVIANGDHIYDDQKTVFLTKPKIYSWYYSLFYQSHFGSFDLAKPMTDERNERTLRAVGDKQIAALYGTSLRSTPSFFLTDDHDTLENDECDDKVTTLPLQGYQEEARKLFQSYYYPEFLPDANRPSDVSSELNGTLRWGKLLEAVLYDCRHVTEKNVISQVTEDWLLKRTAAEDTTHFMHVPSIPFIYSAGKLGEWYPDIVNDEGKLTSQKSKRGYKMAWFEQHQRILSALAKQRKRTPIVLQGDMHAGAVASCMSSGSLSFKENPVHTILTPPLATGDFGYPSFYRKVQAAPSSLVTAAEHFKPQEKNGFTIIDITPEKIRFDLYSWRPPEAIEKIETMAPVFSYEIPSRA
jgi:phosphodiesterase/alkaline phosphatase D-like protein